MCVCACVCVRGGREGGREGGGLCFFLLLSLAAVAAAKQGGCASVFAVVCRWV